MKKTHFSFHGKTDVKVIADCGATVHQSKITKEVEKITCQKCFNKNKWRMKSDKSNTHRYDCNNRKT